MQDLIDRAGGIDRAAEMCGYSRSAVGRWNCRSDQDLMPLAVVIVLEAETGMPLVTRAMCGLNGLECTAAPSGEGHVMGAYVALTASVAALNSEMASAMADGVLTAGKQTKVDEKASDVAQHNEALRQSVAALGGKLLKLSA